jgi:hypothetical protein
MWMIATKVGCAVLIGGLAQVLTGGSGILWAPGSGSGGNALFTLIGLVLGFMIPTEWAFWKSRKGNV